MSDILTRICADKRADVARRKAALPEAALLAGLAGAPPIRPSRRRSRAISAKAAGG